MWTVKHRVREVVEVAKPGDKISKIFDLFILSLIFLNIIAVVIGTVKSVRNSFGSVLDWFEFISVLVFTIEYLLRLWSCVSEISFYSALKKRIQYALKPMLIIDLLAILPFYVPLCGVDFRFLRVLRLMRILRIVKIGRYYSSLKIIRDVIFLKKEELILSLFIMFLLLLVSSCLMYYCENGTQPELFPDIPSTMWWSVTTLTTVGYGDICPVTALGKCFASIIAILGVGMFALPTGILGAGFIEVITENKSKTMSCPHCGREIK